MKSHLFFIKGTHCSSCKIFIEDVLKQEIGLSNIEVDLKKQTLSLNSNLEINQDQLVELITNKIKNNGYSISTKNKQDAVSDQEKIWQALPIGLIILVLFFLIQKSDVLNMGVNGQITPVTSFIIGLIASVSSCLAVVGGLVLSVSAKISQTKNNNSGVALFHFGRLFSFAILGGLLGIIGNTIGINFTITTILGIVASIVMMILGLNLVGVLKINKVVFPTKIFSLFKMINHKTLTPLVLGVGTFFLPCGFTQSMQISALSSGSFTSGLLIMFFFALGTFPTLALLSFGSNIIGQSKYSSLFFKSAGVVVVGLGIFTLLSGLTALGIISPLFSF